MEANSLAETVLAFIEVITWLKDAMRLISSAGETEKLAIHANPEDGSYFIPAFTGLGAPYWDSEASGLFTGITRTTGRNEMVRASPAAFTTRSTSSGMSATVCTGRIWMERNERCSTAAGRKLLRRRSRTERQTIR